MELAWLQDFLTLCSSGNFSRAAEQRHVTQPAFSRRIRSLEEWMGVELFDRTTHPTFLTPAGQWFKPVAEEMVRRTLLAREEAQAIAAGSFATLNFAATHALSLTFFPQWFRRFESALPNLKIGPIRLVSDTLHGCEELMLQGNAHFLLCHYHPAVGNRLDSADFLSMQISQDILLPAITPGLLARSQDARNPAPIASLAYSQESGLGQIVRKLHPPQSRAQEGRPVFTSHLAVVLKTMVLEERGMAWLPKSLIRHELDEGKLVELAGKHAPVPIEIRLFRRRAIEHSGAASFWEFVEKNPEFQGL
ncbi:MAG TPA: LysR family transcriptional regulator [Dongiaceae bacterium]|jgi:DNA-binding transcriptional LysR family regulator|nr:LysR family transcriptional regulator [Dongiaceae bacterium]